MYIGEFIDSKCTGRSVVIFKNGNAYEGFMKDNKRDGKGIYVQGGVGFFDGIFVNDIKNDNGI